MNKIEQFRGKNYFLSNFYQAPVKYQGMFFANNEAAFQGAKVIGTKEEPSRAFFITAIARDAKHRGRHVLLRPDWERVKDQVMHDIVLDKFTRNQDLRDKLLATGNAELIEGNTWHDTYWGYDLTKKRGKNKLGKILMQVREQLRKEL